MKNFETPVWCELISWRFNYYQVSIVGKENNLLVYNIARWWQKYWAHTQWRSEGTANPSGAPDLIHPQFLVMFLLLDL